MPRTSDKRDRLVETAKVLFHQQGYSQTSLADIANVSEVPLGNVYYYFKTKEDLGQKVVEERINDFHALFDEWESAGKGKTALLNQLVFAEQIKETLARFGCPIGSLCQELNKEPCSLTNNANDALKMFVTWAEKQFHEINTREAHQLAIQFVAGLQGAILLAVTMKDPQIISNEVTRLKEWVINSSILTGEKNDN